jgi:hypothetical protein
MMDMNQLPTLPDMGAPMDPMAMSTPSAHLPANPVSPETIKEFVGPEGIMGPAHAADIALQAYNTGNEPLARFFGTLATDFALAKALAATDGENTSISWQDLAKLAKGKNFIARADVGTPIELTNETLDRLAVLRGLAPEGQGGMAWDPYQQGGGMSHQPWQDPMMHGGSGMMHGGGHMPTFQHPMVNLGPSFSFASAPSAGGMFMNPMGSSMSFGNQQSMMMSPINGMGGSMMTMSSSDPFAQQTSQQPMMGTPMQPQMMMNPMMQQPMGMMGGMMPQQPMMNAQAMPHPMQQPMGMMGGMVPQQPMMNAQAMPHPMQQPMGMMGGMMPQQPMMNAQAMPHPMQQQMMNGQGMFQPHPLMQGGSGIQMFPNNQQMAMNSPQGSMMPTNSPFQNQMMNGMGQNMMPQQQPQGMFPQQQQHTYGMSDPMMHQGGQQMGGQQQPMNGSFPGASPSFGQMPAMPTNVYNVTNFTTINNNYGHLPQGPVNSPAQNAGQVIGGQPYGGGGQSYRPQGMTMNLGPMFRV